MRALAHEGQAVLLTALLEELDRDAQANILECPRAVWDLMTCGGATEVVALIAAFSAPQRTRALGSAMAVAALVWEHRSPLWGWLDELPPASHAIILRAENAIGALVIDRDSASRVAGMLEALDSAAQFRVLSRTSAVAQLVRHGQSTRVLALLARRSGAELSAILPFCGALQLLATQGHVGKLAELVSMIAPADRAGVLHHWDGLNAFTQHGRRKQVKEWVLALDEKGQQRLFASQRGILRELVSGDAADVEELKAALGPASSRLLSSALHDVQLREGWRQQALAAIGWLEEQPQPGSFSISDRATWLALRSGSFDVDAKRHVAALTKLTLVQRAELLTRPAAVSLFARRGAAAATAQLIAELPQRAQTEILREPSAIAALIREGAAAQVVRMFEALPPLYQIRLFREVRGDWKESLWPPHTLATKLALLLGDLDPSERFAPARRRTQRSSH